MLPKLRRSWMAKMVRAITRMFHMKKWQASSCSQAVSFHGHVVSILPGPATHMTLPPTKQRSLRKPLSAHTRRDTGAQASGSRRSCCGSSCRAVFFLGKSARDRIVRVKTHLVSLGTRTPQQGKVFSTVGAEVFSTVGAEKNGLLFVQEQSVHVAPAFL